MVILPRDEGEGVDIEIEEIETFFEEDLPTLLTHFTIDVRAFNSWS